MTAKNSAARSAAVMLACASLGTVGAHALAAKPLPMRAARPGYFQGRVTVADGRPLAGAEIDISGTTAAGQPGGAGLHTDAQGRYSAKLAPGTYSVNYAVYHDLYAGRAYTLPLAPRGGRNDDADVSAGAVRDFALKISGPIAPDKDPADGRSYYGGSLQVEGAVGSAYLMGFPTGSTVELTLTPQGPLMDGSFGKPLTRKGTRSGMEFVYNDIPLGRYAVTARLIGADGAATPLQVSGLASDDDATDGPGGLVGVFPPTMNIMHPLTWPGTDRLRIAVK